MNFAARTLVAIAALAGGGVAQATVIASGIAADHSSFVGATGATSLTGPLPEIGNAGNSETIGDATLSAGNSIFVGSGWSSLLPNGRAIAISGVENVEISIDIGLANSFGFYFHEPGSSEAKLDGCNTASFAAISCEDSTFSTEFLLGGSTVGSLLFNAADDAKAFVWAELDEAFDEVRITETTGGIDNEFFGEMYATRVPEPSSLILLGGGLLGFAWMRRRRGY